MQVYRQFRTAAALFNDILIAGWHDHPLQRFAGCWGNGCAEREPASNRDAYSFCAYIFNPERCFSLIGKSDPSAGKLRFDDSEHPFHRLCGTKE
jgi:hypothetical protein